MLGGRRWPRQLRKLSDASFDGLGPAANGAETAAAAALRRTRRPPRLAALTEYALVLDDPLNSIVRAGAHATR
jgi:hypothetical protein